MPQPPSQTDVLLTQLVAETKALRADIEKLCVLMLATQYELRHSPEGMTAASTWSQCVALAKSFWKAGV